MENRFGTDFGDVRVHNDSKAIQMNQELKSLAFTHGRDIYFNKGTYNPELSTGKQLIAHELTHTIQQSKNVTSGIQKFDDKKMFKIARKSKRVKELEKLVIKKGGYTYGGQVEGRNSYTNITYKKIYIEKGLSEEQAALNYAYELQNAYNSTTYNKIIKKAGKGKYNSASQYANDILRVEVDALINEAQVAIELGIENEKKEVKALVEKYNKKKLTLKQLKDAVFEWINKSGEINGLKPKEHYEKQFKNKKYKTKK